MASLDTTLIVGSDDMPKVRVQDHDDSRICTVSVEEYFKHWTLQGSPEDVVNFLQAALNGVLAACAERWPDEPESDDRRVLDHELATGERQPNALNAFVARCVTDVVEGR